MGVNYDPSVYIKAIKSKETSKAIQELSKYMVKSSDYLHGDLFDTKALEILMVGLKGVQSVSYTGEFRKIKAKIKSDEDDLIHITEKESGKQVIQFVHSIYERGAKKYYVCQVSDWQEINFDEKRKANEKDKKRSKFILEQQRKEPTKQKYATPKILIKESVKP